MIYFLVGYFLAVVLLVLLCRLATDRWML